MFLNLATSGNEPAGCELFVQVPRMKIVSTKGLSRSAPGWGLFVFACDIEFPAGNNLAGRPALCVPAVPAAA